MFFLFQLVQMSLNPVVKSKNKIFVVSVLKFPVLYLIGFLILKSRFFPMDSILIGLSIFLAVFLIAWIRFNARNPKVILILLFCLGIWTGRGFCAERVERRRRAPSCQPRGADRGSIGGHACFQGFARL